MSLIISFPFFVSYTDLDVWRVFLEETSSECLYLIMKCLMSVPTVLASCQVLVTWTRSVGLGGTTNGLLQGHLKFKKMFSINYIY